jgi:hypothetical protein
MQNFDLAARYNLNVELYSQQLDHNVQAPVLTGIVSNLKPYAVFLVDTALPAGESVAGFAWSVDANNAPLVTVQFTNSSLGVYCQIAVCYKL